MPPDTPAEAWGANVPGRPRFSDSPRAANEKTIGNPIVVWTGPHEGFEQAGAPRLTARRRRRRCRPGPAAERHDRWCRAKGGSVFIYGSLRANLSRTYISEPLFCWPSRVTGRSAGSDVSGNSGRVRIAQNNVFESK